MSDLRNAVINVLDFLEYGGRRHDRILHIDTLREALKYDNVRIATVDCRQCQHLDRKKNCASDQPCTNGDKFAEQQILQLYLADKGEALP